MFATRLDEAGGRVSFAHPSDLTQAVIGAVDPASPVVLTPELSWLVGALRDRGIAAVVGSRAGAAAAEPRGDVEGAVDGDVGRATSGEAGGLIDGDLESLLRRAGTGVTGCIAAVASSGTIVVGPGGGNGGLIAALPPRHVAILYEIDIRESLAETLAVVRERTAQSLGEYVLVTGPSRTADIEMMSVVGVHGPVALEVIVVGGDST